jgi:N-acetylglucosaminyl-diphospho-decaprenol L-rhamnosyltransferase
MGEAADSGVDLSILIVSYNTREITLACLASVFAHPPTVSHEVIVLDNDSGDGSAEAIRDAFPQAKLIAHPQNCGFAEGNNIAAMQASGRRLLLLNPDTLVFENSLQALWDFAEASPARGIWGGRTLFGDMSLNPTSCWAQISLWSLFCSAVGLTMIFPRSSLFNPEAYGGWRRDGIREVDIVTGCFLQIDHVLWKQLGGFDETFFMYAEEADLCLRARALGARPAITAAAEIVHLGGASEKSAVEKVIKVHRGRVTLIRKHWPPLRVGIGLTFYRFWAWSRMLASHLVSGPRDGPGTAVSKWAAVWARRAEWLGGYPIRGKTPLV